MAKRIFSEKKLKVDDLKNSQLKISSRYNEHIALFGGSFNPITKEHLRMASSVLNRFSWIAQVWLVPSFRHPFGKNNQYHPQRIEMLKTCETPRIRLSLVEKSIGGRGTTFNLVQHLQLSYPHVHFYFILGADCVLDFDQRWHNPGKLISMLRFIIFPRPNFDLQNYAGLLSGGHFYFMDHFLTSNLSSSQVREKSRRGKDVREMVPEGVAAILDTHPYLMKD